MAKQTNGKNLVKEALQGAAALILGFIGFCLILTGLAGLSGCDNTTYEEGVGDCGPKWYRLGCEPATRTEFYRCYDDEQWNLRNARVTPGSGATTAFYGCYDYGYGPDCYDVGCSDSQSFFYDGQYNGSISGCSWGRSTARDNPGVPLNEIDPGYINYVVDEACRWPG